jgi:predicted nucleic acid-binding protein
MIVVDANILISLHVPGESSEDARAALKREQWAAPVLWKSEFCSGLTRLRRAGKLQLDECLEYLKQAEGMMWGRSFSVQHPKVLAYAERSKASTYDCEYVVLADDLGLKLVTLDGPLVKHFPETAIHLRDYVSSRG